MIGPAFVTTRQLGEPAGSSVRAEIGMLTYQQKLGEVDQLLGGVEIAMRGDVGVRTNREKERNEAMVVFFDRFSGGAWGMAAYDDVDHPGAKLELDELLKSPLRNFLGIVGVPYVEHEEYGPETAAAAGHGQEPAKGSSGQTHERRNGD